MATFRFTKLLTNNLSVLVIAVGLCLTYSPDSSAEIAPGTIYMPPSMPIVGPVPTLPTGPSWYVDMHNLPHYYVNGVPYTPPPVPPVAPVSPIISVGGPAVVVVGVIAVGVEAEIIREGVQSVNDSGQPLTPWEQDQILGNPIIAAGIAILDFFGF